MHDNNESSTISVINWQQGRALVNKIGTTDNPSAATDWEKILK